MTRSLIGILVMIVVLQKASAQIEKKITRGGYIDTQYAFDFNTPANGDRAFTTQQQGIMNLM